MQRSQLIKNVGYRVRLRPVACRLNDLGLELPQMDDDWIILSVNEAGIPISNISTHHQTTLGFDHIHHFTSDTTRVQGETKFGFLTLLVQIYMRGPNLSIQPTLRPGERVPPPSVKVIEKIVDLRYPADSGLQADLEARGYRVMWSLESNLSRRVDLHGWDRVILRDDDGSLVQFRARNGRDDLVLICRTNS